MHYLIYQITNTKNGKIYIGCHQTVDPDDGYMGSGSVLKKAITKHGIDSFTKTILHDFDSSEAMFAKEAELVNEEFVDRKDTYNINTGGHGGWDYVNRDGSKPRNKPWMPLAWQNSKKVFKERMQDPEYAKKFCENNSRSKKEYYASNPHPWIDRNHTEQTKMKISQHAKLVGQYKGSLNPTYGKKWMTNGTDSKPATKEEQESLLTSGWRYGRIIKK